MLKSAELPFCLVLFFSTWVTEIANLGKCAKSFTAILYVNSELRVIQDVIRVLKKIFYDVLPSFNTKQDFNSWKKYLQHTEKTIKIWNAQLQMQKKKKINPGCPAWGTETVSYSQCVLDFVKKQLIEIYRHGNSSLKDLYCSNSKTVIIPHAPQIPWCRVFLL